VKARTKGVVDKGVFEGAVSNKIVCDDCVIVCYPVPSDE
jgi:hypothetical protein